MSKRRNENGQMRREDYEAENDRDGDSGGEGGFEGGFQRAPDEAIARRKIVTARVGGKRQAPTAPPAAAAAAPKASPFAGFKGLASEESPAKPNPFAGFSGLISAAPLKPATSLGFGTTASTPAPTPSSATNPKSSPTTYQEAIEVLNKEFLEFVTQQLKANPSSDWSAAVNDYAEHARVIGAKFASTKPIAAAIRSTPLQAPRSQPVALSGASASSFRLAPKQDDTPSPGFSFGTKKDGPALGSTAVPTPSKSATSSEFSFGVPKTTSAKESQEAQQAKPVTVPNFALKSTDEKPVPSFTFGAAPFGSGASEATKPVTGGFSFGAGSSTAPATGGFSFGAAKPATSSTGGFSFNLSASSATSAPATPFSFGGPTVNSTTSTEAPGDGGDEDEENIGREEATVILKSDNPDEECVFEVEKAKIIEFKKDEKRWADKGTHPLKVLINKNTKNARILVRNEIGKIVLNSALYKGLAVKTHEAKGKKVGALLALQVDAAITQFILKVNGEKVDAFIAALEDATPK